MMCVGGVGSSPPPPLEYLTTKMGKKNWRVKNLFCGKQSLSGEFQSSRVKNYEDLDKDNFWS